MGVASYVINFDELVEGMGQNFGNELVKALKDALGSGLKVDGSTITVDTSSLENAVNLLKNDSNSKNQDILKILESIASKMNANTKEQRIKGDYLNISAFQKDFELTFQINGLFNGITFSQSAWRWEDTWSLYIDGKLICNNIRTKEIAEHKFFDNYIKANTIKYVYHNNSGTSKMVWVDIEYLE